MIKKILGYSSMEQIEKSMTKKEKEHRKKTEEERKLSQGEFIGINFEKEVEKYKLYFRITQCLIAACPKMGIDDNKFFTFFNRIFPKNLEKIYDDWIEEYLRIHQKDMYVYYPHSDEDYLLSINALKFFMEKINHYEIKSSTTEQN